MHNYSNSYEELINMQNSLNNYLDCFGLFIGPQPYKVTMSPKKITEFGLMEYIGFDDKNLAEFFIDLDSLHNKNRQYILDCYDGQSSIFM